LYLAFTGINKRTRPFELEDESENKNEKGT
jgi:hypothetical protein